MASPENTHPNQPNPHLSGVEGYDSRKVTHAPDGDSSLTLPDAPPIFTQPDVSFPDYANRYEPHHDGVSRVKQLIEDAGEGTNDLRLPQGTDPRLIALATRDPKDIRRAEQGDSDALVARNMANPSRPWKDVGPSEISDYKYEVEKSLGRWRTVRAVGGAGLMWAAIQYGLPSNNTETARNVVNVLAGVASPILGTMYYGFSLLWSTTERQQQKLAQKTVKKLQKQEQQRRAMTENHSN